MSLRIGIDLMGGDSSPTSLFKAVEQAALTSSVNFLVFVTQTARDAIELSFSSFLSSANNQVEFHLVTEVIFMHEDPLKALKEKKYSSLSLSLKSLERQEIDALVSIGNTGALVAESTFMLSCLPGITRPALLTLLPTDKQAVAVIDVGGHISYKAFHLLQFAQLGSAYQYYKQGITVPRVGLLNIGKESKKGTSEIRKAYQLLNDSINQKVFQFVGNVEADEVFHGNVDVVVTDGFTGNIFLKTTEGVSQFMLKKLTHLLKQTDLQMNETILSYLNVQFNDEEYPGAIISGIERLIIKCHGKSTSKGLLSGIEGAIQLVTKKFIQQTFEFLSVHEKQT